MRATILRGRAFVVRDERGAPIDDIDTDMIFHNAHLALTDVAQMGRHAFGNLPGWKDFPQQAQPGDILVVGENFGCGSSRQQAVDCFRALRVAALVGESFGAIYQRNAINSGMPLVVAPGVVRRPAGATGHIATGDEIEVDLAGGTLRNVSRGEAVPGAQPLSRVQLDIYQAGDLMAYGATAKG
ncbi:MAG: 3-isopropylmalate dehydratase [Deltaproteobacteria bacterium]|nr:3-isopropylmalate dehydratase [Deltaproteobacteria bacterium]